MSASRPQNKQLHLSNPHHHHHQQYSQQQQQQHTQQQSHPVQTGQNQPWKTVKRGTSIRSFSSRGSTGSVSRLPPTDSLTFFPPFEQTQMRPRHAVPEDATEEERALWADWVASADRASLTASLQSLRMQHAPARDPPYAVEFSLREGSVASLSSIAEGSSFVALSTLTGGKADSVSSRRSSTSLCLGPHLPSWAAPGPASPVADISPVNGTAEFSLPATNLMPDPTPVLKAKKITKTRDYGTFQSSTERGGPVAVNMPPSVRLMREIGDRSSISLHSSVPDLSYSCSTDGATETTSLLPEYNDAYRDRRERSKRGQENDSPLLLPPSQRGKLAITPLGDVISIQPGRSMHRDIRPRPRAAVPPTRKDFTRRQALPPLEVFIPPQSEEGSPADTPHPERPVTPDFTDLRAFARLGKTEQEPLPPRTPSKRDQKPRSRKAGSDGQRTDDEPTPRISRGWNPLVRQ